MADEEEGSGRGGAATGALRAEAAAAIRERDAMAQELRLARAEVTRLQATLAGTASSTEEPWVAHEQAAVLRDATDALEQGRRNLDRQMEEQRTAELVVISALLQSVADSIPHLVWSSKPGGDWRYGNRRWTEHTGQSVQEANGFGWLDVVHPEECDRVMVAWHQSPSVGELRVEHRLRGRDGTYEWFETRSVPMCGTWDGEDDETERWFGTSTNVDVTRRAEEALRASEARFRGFADATPEVLWVVDAESGHLEHLSPACEQVWGEPRDAIMSDLGRWAELLHPEDRDAALGGLLDALGGKSSDPEYRITRQSHGAVRWLRDIGFPVRDTDGRVRPVAGQARDVTDRKDAEVGQGLLLAELNHRLKNALAAAQSVAALTARSATSPKAFSVAFQTRLVALARAHDLLTREAWRGASLAEVVRLTLAPHGSGNSGAERVSVVGPGVRLRPEAAIALHMALHELATNGAKYGALSALSGRVEVWWRVTDREASENGGVLELSWWKRGGPAVREPDRRGFGSRLLEQTLPRQLGGRAMVTFAPSGLKYRLEAPLGGSLTQDA
jgi:PAS domain S-box-containing protein